MTEALTIWVLKYVDRAMRNLRTSYGCPSLSHFVQNLTRYLSLSLSARAGAKSFNGRIATLPSLHSHIWRVLRSDYGMWRVLILAELSSQALYGGAKIQANLFTAALPSTWTWYVALISNSSPRRLGLPSGFAASQVAWREEVRSCERGT